MPLDRPRILLIEDALPLARLYQEYLRAESYDVVHVDCGEAALAEIRRRVPEAMILDLKLPDMSGIDILRYLHDNKIQSSVVMITAHGTVDSAVDAMRYGAFDFIMKPFRGDRLVITLRNALERQRLTRIVETYRNELDRHEYCGFIGASLAMQAIYRIIDSAAPSRATVFITGESGTGKEVCAEAIHQQSPRGDQPFIALNCAAIPSELIESEIFGHVKGAFTGAVATRDGAAQRAHGGTLFLDEICELPYDLQSKLLRFVQTGSFSKVGSSALEKVDVRIVCATNRDPLREVEEGRFREDLYYRLHVIPIRLPPLRDRQEDVVTLARHFLRLFASEEGKSFQDFAPDALGAIAAYEWPGNVRQLQNVIRNIVVLQAGETVTLDMLPDTMRDPLASGRPVVSLHGQEGARVNGAKTAAAPPTIRPMAVMERELIEEAMRVTNGNIPQAAALLEISPSTIYRKLSRWQPQASD
jgi:two-component system, repressor protein LuxO